MPENNGSTGNRPRPDDMTAEEMDRRLEDHAEAEASASEAMAEYGPPGDCPAGDVTVAEWLPAAERLAEWLPAAERLAEWLPAAERLVEWLPAFTQNVGRDVHVLILPELTCQFCAHKMIVLLAFDGEFIGSCECSGCLDKLPAALDEQYGTTRGRQ